LALQKYFTPDFGAKKVKINFELGFGKINFNLIDRLHKDDLFAYVSQIRGSRLQFVKNNYLKPF